MQKVLIGYSHAKGVIEENGVAYDNLNLYCADYNEGELDKGGCVGYKPYGEPVKVKFSEFEKLTGVSPSYFFSNFEATYFNSYVQAFYEVNIYGRKKLAYVRFLDPKTGEPLA